MWFRGSCDFTTSSTIDVCLLICSFKLCINLGAPLSQFGWMTQNRVTAEWISYHKPAPSLAWLHNLHPQHPRHSSSPRWKLVRRVINSSTATHPSALFARPRVAPAILSGPRRALPPAQPPLQRHPPVQPLTMHSAEQRNRLLHHLILPSFSALIVFYCFYLNFSWVRSFQFLFNSFLCRRENHVITRYTIS